MNIPMPPVRNEYRVEDIDVVFAIMAYRRLTVAEINASYSDSLAGFGVDSFMMWFPVG